MIDMLLRGVAWLGVGFAGFATVVCALILADGNYCWSAFTFTMMAGAASTGTMFLGILPSWLRYFKTRQPNDRTTLRLLSSAFLVLIVEAVALQIIPQRGE